MILYFLLCLYMWQPSLVASCTLETNQEPEKMNDVPQGNPIHFTCTSHGTCDVSIISIETQDAEAPLMMRNSSYYIIPNKEIEFNGNLTKFTITMKVYASNYYYCTARVLSDGKPLIFKSKGTQITVDKGAGLTVCADMKLLFLLTLICFNAGI
ncbi:hypothetical protein GDO78_019477 [Eleutherodactylus coqui]|uniref:Immunoglobulin subtype domain-containing protein n=1 Tax=Eleutherodactylus coqui TaxID=57060 RepID=A0A8J6JU56_ELECQ|nr:hypothetical protein GDO78_019477 [Eleutherodactylus coqui]